MNALMNALMNAFHFPAMWLSMMILSCPEVYIASKTAVVMWNASVCQAEASGMMMMIKGKAEKQRDDDDDADAAASGGITGGTGLVVDIGHQFMQCVPVVEGFPVANAALSTAFAGAQFTTYLSGIVNSKNRAYHGQLAHGGDKEVSK